MRDSEILPLTALLMVIALHWEQFISLMGLAPARFDLVPKAEPLPWPYLAAVLSATALFELLPYVEELFRGLRKPQTEPR